MPVAFGGLHCFRRDLGHRSYLFLQGPGSVDGGAVAAGAPGQESTEGAPPLYNTNHDFKFSYSEINFQDLSWSFRNLYKSMLERSSASQHGECRGTGGWHPGSLCLSSFSLTQGFSM